MKASGWCVPAKCSSNECPSNFLPFTTQRPKAHLKAVATYIRLPVCTKSKYANLRRTEGDSLKPSCQAGAKIVSPGLVVMSTGRAANEPAQLGGRVAV